MISALCSRADRKSKHLTYLITNPKNYNYMLLIYNSKHILKVFTSSRFNQTGSCCSKIGLNSTCIQTPMQKKSEKKNYWPAEFTFTHCVIICIKVFKLISLFKWVKRSGIIICEGEGERMRRRRLKVRRFCFVCALRTFHHIRLTIAASIHTHTHLYIYKRVGVGARQHIAAARWKSSLHYTFLQQFISFAITTSCECKKNREISSCRRLNSHYYAFHVFFSLQLCNFHHSSLIWCWYESLYRPWQPLKYGMCCTFSF